MKSYIELILLFGIIYFTYYFSFQSGFKPENIITMWNSIYFSGVTITTLGYGDISPVEFFPQLMTLYEVINGFTLIIVSFTVYVSRSVEENSYVGN